MIGGAEEAGSVIFFVFFFASLFMLLFIAAELDAKRAIDQGTRLAAVIETANTGTLKPLTGFDVYRDYLKSGEIFDAPFGWETKLLAKMHKYISKN